MSDPAPVVTVGGIVIPFSHFSMTGGAYGSVGHVTITTTRSLLEDIKLDLFTLTSGSPGFLEVAIAIAQPPPPQQPVGGWGGGGAPPGKSSSKRIFGGEYENTDYDMDRDTVQIHARDWAGVLVDQKRILTKIGKAVEQVLAPLAPGRVTVAGISNENQQVGNIITSIATEFGFTPILNLSASGRNPTVGTLYGSGDQSFIQVPQTLWSILNSLARDTGYNVYVTPNKELVFGEAGAGLDTINLSWNATPQQGQMPCRNTRFQHHPRRNSTFRVLVMSYDPGLAQSTLGRATYIGANYAGQVGLVAGMATGQAAVTADQSILALQQGAGTSTLPAADALPVISLFESGNQNVPNASGPGGTPASTASGYYQIINGTWAQFAPSAGVNLTQYPTAMSAPLATQTAVATRIYNEQGLAPWSSNRKLMAAMGGGGGGRFGVTQIPLYAFHLDGLSADQAALRAESIATDIAKRELILSTTIDGLPSVLPTQKIQITGDIPSDMSAPTYYVSGYEQTFSLPSSQSLGSDSGWVTKLTALNIPTESLDSATDRGIGGAPQRAPGSKSSVPRSSTPGKTTTGSPPRKEG